MTELDAAPPTIPFPTRSIAAEPSRSRSPTQR